jgi:hypothetical protein
MYSPFIRHHGKGDPSHGDPPFTAGLTGVSFIPPLLFIFLVIQETRSPDARESNWQIKPACCHEKTKKAPKSLRGLCAAIDKFSHGRNRNRLLCLYHFIKILNTDGYNFSASHFCHL